MKKTLLILFLFSAVVYGQELTVASSSTITVENGASINIGGLELAPSVDYAITGAITVSKSETPVTGSSGGASIDRVYNNSVSMDDFIGTITFFYEEDELINSGASESTLKLQVKESPSENWTSYIGTIDEGLNTIMYEFITPGVNFLSVTASGDGITLPVEDVENLFGAISIYPNPTTSELKIATDKKLSFELYSILGHRILKTKNSTIEMSHLPNAVYLLKVTNEDSNFSKSYRIVKE